MTTKKQDIVLGVISKEGPSFTILQTCTGCKYHNLNKGQCEDLGCILIGNKPNENCKFLVHNSIEFFTNEISKSKNKDKAKVLNILKEIFPDSYETEYDENEISILNEDFDENDVKKLKIRLPNYSFHIRPNQSDSFYICLTRNKT